MKSFAIAGLIVVSAVNALNTSEFDFMNYLAKFNKVYSEVEEFHTRLANYNTVDAFIREHNATPG